MPRVTACRSNSKSSASLYSRCPSNSFAENQAVLPPRDFAYCSHVGLDCAAARVCVPVISNGIDTWVKFDWLMLLRNRTTFGFESSGDLDTLACSSQRWYCSDSPITCTYISRPGCVV